MEYEKSAYTDTEESRVLDKLDDMVKGFSDNVELGQFFINTREIVRYFRDKGTYLGNGRNRVTYKLKGKNIVVKIPRNTEGEVDNMEERDRWKRYKDKDVLAQCWLARFGGVSILFMEYVVEQNVTRAMLDDVVGKGKRRRSIAGFCRDGYQMGFSSDGKLRFYDYAY